MAERKNNFNEKGFTTFGLSNYSFLREKNFSRERAVSILAREDKAKKNAETFRERYKDKIKWWN